MSLRIQAREERQQVVEQARELMRGQIADPELALRDIAAELSISTRHLQRAFCEAESQGYRYELARMRMLEAARMFRGDPSITVAQVAERVGYRQPHRFAKAFKRHTGYWPKDFRRRCRTQLSAAAA